jgi:hypothetical protein
MRGVFGDREVDLGVAVDIALDRLAVSFPVLSYKCS